MSALNIKGYNVPDIVITAAIGSVGVWLLYKLATRAIPAIVGGAVDTVVDAYSPGGVAYNVGDTIQDWLIPDALAGYQGASLGTAVADVVDWIKGTDYTSANYPNTKAPDSVNSQKLPDYLMRSTGGASSSW